MIWYFVALIVLIALSAFCSASEMAYSSANPLRLENLMEDGSARARSPITSPSTLTMRSAPF